MTSNHSCKMQAALNLQAAANSRRLTTIGGLRKLLPFPILYPRVPVMFLFFEHGMCSASFTCVMTDCSYRKQTPQRWLVRAMVASGR
eukprot:2633603-Amphidinium_carterae.1